MAVSKQNAEDSGSPKWTWLRGTPHPAATWTHRLSRFLMSLSSDALLLSCVVCLFTCHPVALRMCLSAPPPPRAQMSPSPHRNFAASPGDWQSAERLTKSTKTNLWGNFPGRKSQFPPRFRNRMGVRLVTDYLLGYQQGMGKNC